MNLRDQLVELDRLIEVRKVEVDALESLRDALAEAVSVEEGKEALMFAAQMVPDYWETPEFTESAKRLREHMGTLQNRAQRRRAGVRG